MASKVGWKIDKMPEKVIAMASYHGALARAIDSDPSASNRIRNAGASIISRYFDAYVDAAARMDPSRYHHIYEFGMTGSKNGRLFKSSIKNGEISYSLQDASVPNNNGYPFTKKAFVMEAGRPVVINPNSSTLLVYELNGETIFSEGSVVQSPGGAYVAGAFNKIFSDFFRSGMPAKALEEFGFFKEIILGIEKESMSAFSQITSGQTNRAEQMAKDSANSIAGKVEQNGNRL